MTVQRISDRLIDWTLRLLRWLAWRLRFWFTARSWVGKTLIIAAGLCTLGYLADATGADAIGRELWQAGILVGSVLVTVLILRQIWRTHFEHHS